MIINQVVPHTLSLLTYLCLPSLSTAVSLALSETAHLKAISDWPARCTSAENHKLFYWMKSLQSDELSVADSRYNPSPLCVQKYATRQVLKKNKNSDSDFKGF